MLVALGPLAFSLALLPFMPSLWTTALRRVRILLRLLRLRAAVPRPVPGHAATRPSTGVLRGSSTCSAASRSEARSIARRRPLPRLGALAVPRRRDRRLRRRAPLPSSSCARTAGTGAYSRASEPTSRHSWRVLRREPEVRTFLIANTAWEGTFAGMRTFVVLYITVGLGKPLGTTTAVLGAVAGGYVVAALVSRAAGRPLRARARDPARLAGLRQRSARRRDGDEWHTWYLPVVFLVAIAGGSVMTLAWGLLFKLMPPQRSRCDLGPRDHDEGHRAHPRPAPRRGGDRRPSPAPSRDEGLPGRSGRSSGSRSCWSPRSSHG